MEALQEEVKSDPDLKIDLWICNHFKVLPTEDRFKNLTRRQKYMLLLGYIHNPTSEELRLGVLTREAEKAKSSLSKEQEAALAESGFSQEQLDEMQQQLAVLGGQKDG